MAQKRPLSGGDASGGRCYIPVVEFGCLLIKKTRKKYLSLCVCVCQYHDGCISYIHPGYSLRCHDSTAISSVPDRCCDPHSVMGSTCCRLKINVRIPYVYVRTSYPRDSVVRHVIRAFILARPCPISAHSSSLLPFYGSIVHALHVYYMPTCCLWSFSLTWQMCTLLLLLLLWTK